jgi:predicted kinase
LVKNNYTIEQRIAIIEEQKVHKMSDNDICKKYKIEYIEFEKWYKNYEEHKIFSLSVVSKKAINDNLTEVKDYTHRPVLSILIGIPCPGKSYYANSLAENQNAIVISSNEIRREKTGTYQYLEYMNKEIFDLAHKRIIEALGHNNYVVFDASNTNRKYRKKVINIGRKLNPMIIGTVFETSIETCNERNNVRSLERKLPEHKLEKWSAFELNIDICEGFDDIKYI